MSSIVALSRARNGSGSCACVCWSASASAIIRTCLRLRGKRVTLCGWVVTYRHVGTKNYRNMMFVTLEDQRGVYEVVLFPDAYDR